MDRLLIRRILRIIFCGVFLGGLGLNTLPPTPVTASAPAGSDITDFEAFFDPFLQEQMSADHIVGATVAVVKDGELAFAKGYGYADLEAKLAVQADQTLFFIGSDGKLFTWTAVMQLAEQGKLDLHADINTYLDFEIPAAFGQPITLHHLMTHTAGFEDDFNSLFVSSGDQVLPLREHLLRYIPQRVYAPGVVSAYSNYGTALAGYIVERVSGQPFEAYLAEHILKPLGMDHSVSSNAISSELSANLSKGYQYQNGNFTSLDYEWTAASPCAPIRATASDISSFMIAHLNGGCAGGGCILRPETLNLMHSPQFTHHPQMSGMTYGFLDIKFNGQRVLWHMGESPRFVTILALIPEQNVGLMVSYNTPPADGHAVLERFMDAFFPVDRPLLNEQPLPGWGERAEQFNGVYFPARSAHTTPQIVIRNLNAVPIAVDRGSLTFNGMRFSETEPGLFQQTDGDRLLAFKQDENGQRWLFMGPLAYFRAAWYQTPGFLLWVLGGCFLVYLSAWVVWPLRALRLGRKKEAAPRTGAFWLAGTLGLYNFGLLGWLAVLLINFGGTFVFPQEYIRLISGLFWLTLPWTLAVLSFAARAWLRREGSVGQRIHYSLVAAAAVAFMWLLWSFKLIGTVV